MALPGTNEAVRACHMVTAGVCLLMCQNQSPVCHLALKENKITHPLLSPSYQQKVLTLLI
uniref:Uncharacterized protein n=1 Tax=Romanomermis culicivorax TaxID=13658 RepID=A0A915I774_ROMCU